MRKNKHIEITPFIDMLMILLVIFIVLVAVSKFNVTSTSEEEIKELNQKIENLQKEILQKDETLSKYTKDLENKDSLLSEKDKSLQEKENELKRLASSKSEKEKCPEIQTQKDKKSTEIHFYVSEEGEIALFDLRTGKPSTVVSDRLLDYIRSSVSNGVGIFHYKKGSETEEMLNTLKRVTK